MKKKIIVIILAILVAITIGVIAYNILNKPEKEINEEVKIPNSDFKLNDVLNKFLETKYAHDNKCTGNIKDNGLQIQCNKQEFIYKLDNVELFTNTSKEGFDVFKNLVIVIETLNGYKENEYEETINKVINNELYVNGIKYQNINNEIYLSIVINEKLDKYEAKEDGTIKITGVPVICFEMNTKDLFMDILDGIDITNRTNKQDIEEKFIATVACKAAVKAHMVLSREEVTELLDKLLLLPNPFTCPHGRPTAIKMTKNDIEKKFARR